MKSTWRLEFYLSLLLWLMSGLLPLVAANIQVTIVRNNDNSYYSQTRQSLTQQLNADFLVSVVGTDFVASQGKKLNASDIIITMGIDAALEISGKFSKSKIISAYITLKQQRQYQTQLESHCHCQRLQHYSRHS